MTFSSNAPVTGQVNFNRYMPPAVPGMLSGTGQAKIYPHTNTYGTLDTITITPPATVDNSATYKVTLNSTSVVSVEFTTDANATTAELANGLFAAMRTNPIFYSLVDVALNTGTNVITLTARSVGTTISLTQDSAGTTTNDLTIAKTVSTSSNLIIPFGRFVGRQASYPRDAREGVSAATLINHATNYEVLGVTLSSHATEQVGIFNNAVGGYAFTKTMNVLQDVGTYKGVWVECVESNLIIGDSAYIAVGSGNEGKVTKTSSGNVDVTSKVKILSATEVSFGKNIVLCEVKL